MARTARQMLRSTVTAAGALTVVAGTALLAAPAAGATEPFNMYDVDGNGLDPYVADSPGHDHPYQSNGVLDQNVITVNGALLWLYDRDEDSRPDAYGNDNNGDGSPDLWGYDPDENWIVDSWVYDPAVFAAQPTFGPGLTLNIKSQPLGTSIYDVMDTVNREGGIVTDPCAFYNGVALSGTNVGCGYVPA